MADTMKNPKEKPKEEKMKETREKPSSSGPKKEDSKIEKSKKSKKEEKEKAKKSDVKTAIRAVKVSELNTARKDVKLSDLKSAKRAGKVSEVKTAKIIAKVPEVKTAKNAKVAKKNSKKNDDKDKNTVKVEEGKAEPKPRGQKRSNGAKNDVQYVSDDDEEAHSEDIIVYETAEDIKFIEHMALAKLARMGFRRPLWTNKLSSYFVMIAFLNTYDTMITFTLCMSVYGAVFALVYCIMMMLVGFPLLYMELALGQFTSNNIYGVFDRMSPAFAGIGIAATLFNFMQMINDQMLVTYTMNLFFKSINIFTNEMPWHNCVSSTNSESCRELHHKCDEYQEDYSDLPDGIAEELGLRYKSMGSTCVRSKLHISSMDGIEDWHLRDLDKVPHYKWLTGESLGQHFFWNMEVGANSMKYLTYPTYEFLMYSMIAWGIVYICCQMSKNFIPNYSKFLVITTISVLGTFSFIALVVHRPKNPYLYSTQTNIIDVFEAHDNIWGMFVYATLLVVRSMKLGQGAMIYLGSQYPFRNNLVMDCILITGLMCFCPLAYSLCHLLTMDSFILFLVDGDMERWMAVRQQNGDQASFIFSSGHPILQLVMFVQSMRLYAEFEPVIICLFSFMAIVSEIGNKIVRVEIIVTTIADSFPVFADRVGRKVILHLTICVSSILMFLLVSRKGFEMMISFEEVVVPVMGASIILLQLFVVCVCYGPLRLLANILAMNHRKNEEQESRIAQTITNAVVLCLWCFVIPLILIASIIVHFIFKVRLENEAREHHITDLPYIFCIVTLCVVPVIAAIRLLNQYRTSNNVMPVLRSNRDLWGPRSSEDRDHALKFEKMLRTR